MPPAAAAPPARQQRGPAAMPPIPFTAAAHEHVEPVTTDVAGLMGTAQLIRGPLDVPAYGFLRHIYLEVALTGGVAGTAAADYPWSVLQQIMLADVNGAPLFGPLDGYATLWANIVGGYSYRQDPRTDSFYVGTSPNAVFGMRIPVEISRHNGYGAVANQNAASAYKLSYNISTLAQSFTVNPTTSPSVTVRSWAECWSQPNVADMVGRPQQREPLGHGTTQFWSSFTRSGLAAGNLNLQLPRVGNLIRNLVVIARDATGARADTVMPDPIQINWDAKILTLESQRYRLHKQMSHLQTTIARDTGVFFFPLDSFVLGHAGDEEPNLWYPTVQSTRLEFAGTMAVAGGLQVLTNDVAPVEVNPTARYNERSATGFQPNLGQPVPITA